MNFATSWLDAAGLLLIVAYYLLHLLHDVKPGPTQHHIGMLRGFGVPFPAVALRVAFAFELTGCVLLLTGWHADIGITILIAFTVVANALYNRYWTMEEPFRRECCRLLLGANTAVLGGLCLLLENVR
ncbi:MAG: hypothetical protein A3H35_15815 [Betaproteobacteria bacterium RIFCSPLOWO2_02_FULL_62_17]|nr:MAG: hypothetical protein A3H35_15815 [Betaproteobacteria bacterium RIFCSPLOWO2_02_FULL_62_17]